jgi:hypothetical protein
MSYPSYNSVQGITSDGATNITGRWKAFIHSDTSGNKTISLRTFNGEGVTFEGIGAGTVVPVAFNTMYAINTDVANGKLFGLN